jgi:hypothetical protein
VRARGFALFAAWCAASSACAGQAPPPARPKGVTAAARVATPEAERALIKWLDLQAVHGDAAGRRVLYTWTHAAQVDEATRSGKLLLKKDGENGKQSIFDASLAAQPYAVIAQLLALEPFERRRFAWVNPWATSRGFGAESDGDRLIRVVLKKGAVIGRFTPEGGPEVDVDGETISDFELIKHPERLAAVYHVGFTDPTKPETVFREYVLVNESQIEEWSVATPAIRERLELDATMLHLAARSLAGVRIRDGATWAHDLGEGVWRIGARSDDAQRRYEAALAFASAAYQPLPQVVEAIAKGLEALPPQGAPIVHVPDARFPLDRLIPATPGAQRPCVRQGSMCIPIGS